MRPFTQVDVFTNVLTFGNPVAVVHDADDLTTQDMADFARWTNLSETTFLIAPTDRPTISCGSSRPTPSCPLLATPLSARPMPGWRPAASPRTPKALPSSVQPDSYGSVATGRGLPSLHRRSSEAVMSTPRT